MWPKFATLYRSRVNFELSKNFQVFQKKGRPPFDQGPCARCGSCAEAAAARSYGMGSPEPQKAPRLEITTGNASEAPPSLQASPSGQSRPIQLSAARCPLVGAEVSGSSRQPVHANVPAPIKNDLFEGVLLILQRDAATGEPPPLSQFTDKRFWELQVQGRLRQPVAQVFTGVEASQYQKPGIMAKAGANLMMRVARTMMPDLHYSWGAASGEELPHVSTPQFRGVDALIETPPGERPPLLGSHIFVEKEKRFFKKPGQKLHPEFTYTISIFSSFLDLQGWRLRRRWPARARAAAACPLPRRTRWAGCDC